MIPVLLLKQQHVFQDIIKELMFALLAVLDKQLMKLVLEQILHAQLLVMAFIKQLLLILLLLLTLPYVAIHLLDVLKQLVLLERELQLQVKLLVLSLV